MELRTRWQYRLLLLSQDRSLKNAQDALNDLGRDGWEMVTAYTVADAIIFVFKQPIE